MIGKLTHFQESSNYWVPTSGQVCTRPWEHRQALCSQRSQQAMEAEVKQYTHLAVNAAGYQST